jgi:SAM-dependent methyltransferase
MDNGVMQTDPQAHWESVHTTKPVDGVSWWQPSEDLWLDLIDDLDPAPDDLILDVGSGSSLLVDALLARGHRRLAAVDVSPSALARIRGRVGSAPGVDLIAADVRTLRLEAPVAIWHDRAVFHFLIDPADQRAYAESVRAALAPGGHVIVATFAPDGPQTCSGLPVQRYDPATLADALGFAARDIVRSERRVHTTPWGSDQPFTVVVLAGSGAERAEDVAH